MKRNISHIICLNFLFGLITLHVDAQSAILKGKVHDKDESLSSATVSVGRNTIITDKNGEFTMTINSGSYTVMVSYTGYQVNFKNINIKPGETIELYFEMERIEHLNEVVVLGSRSRNKRSSMNTSVPVDVIQGNKLSKLLTDLSQQLNVAFPSFNSPPQTVGGSAFANPVALRGLGIDQTLVLINEKRRHASASVLLQYNFGYGSPPTDLNCIPAAAIDNVQILRDGASAQYGSDALAAVLDIQLKKSTAKTEANFHIGRCYAGDGQTMSFDINHGFSIRHKGFINFTLATRYNEYTQRNGLYDSTVYYPYPPNATQHQKDSVNVLDESKVLARGFDRLNHRPIGAPQVFNSSVIINGAYPLSQRINLFWVGTFNYRRVDDEGSSIYRYPKNKATIADTSLYPNGFQPKTSLSNVNFSVNVGIEGKTSNNWSWDLSSVIGANTTLSYYLFNSNNATQFALGKNAQTSFHMGSPSFIQNTNNINFTRNFADRIKNLESFTVSWGSELRVENFQIKKGEEASWKNYSPSSNKQWGAQGGILFRDSDEVNRTRYVSSAYLELEMEPDKKFLWNIAGRYEYYSDYGANLAGKLSLRYKFSKRFLVRGSISNGFRAPAMQQKYFSTAGPTASGGKIFIGETFRNDDYLAKAFGVPPLQAEKSINLSGGVTSEITNHFNIAIDAYWIQVRDRIILTGLIQRDSSKAIDNILKDLQRTDISAISFFANAVSTRTQGVDVVVTGTWAISKSNLEVDLSGNYNKTHIYNLIQPAANLPNNDTLLNLVINREQRGRIEQSQPLGKIILSSIFTTGKWEFQLRTVYYGKAAHLNSNLDTITHTYPDEIFSPRMLAGFGIGYSPVKWLKITAGARNVFDTYPSKIQNRSNTQGGLAIYDFNGTQIGYNGGYYMVNLNFHL